MATYSGTAGDDVITLSASASATVNAGAGVDTVVIGANRSSFRFTQLGSPVVIDSISSASGSSTYRINLTNVEKVQFNDQTITLTPYLGTTGNDSLYNTSTTETLDGKAGLDAAIYKGKSSDFSITKTSTGLSLQNLTGAEGNDTLNNIERIHFSDHKLAFDLTHGNAAASAVEILSAAFGENAVSNVDYAGVAIGLFDSGQSMVQVAQLAINTGLMGNATSSHSAFVQAVWQNVVHSTIDSSNLATFTRALDQGTYTEASLLAMAAETTLNQAQLVGLAQTGLAFF